MEFMTVNHINPTTMISVNSNTTTAENLFNRDPFYQYVSDGKNSDLSKAVITITFDATTPVSRIALLDTNAKAFSIFYNGVTASTFTLDSNGATTASAWSNLADEGVYMRVAATTMVSSVTLEILSTQVANQEKLVGEFYIGDLLLDMSQIPSARGYKPRVVPKQVIHQMSDGGRRMHNVRRKREENINLEFTSESLRNSLEDVYDLQEPITFVPFGTTTSWNGVLFEAIWDGPFNFYEYSDNAAASGYSGSISLKETAV